MEGDEPTVGTLAVGETLTRIAYHQRVIPAKKITAAITDLRRHVAIAIVDELQIGDVIMIFLDFKNYLGGIDAGGRGCRSLPDETILVE